MKKIPILIIASTAAVIGLVYIQLNWLKTSRELMEETFNQRVCMALCATVEEEGVSNFFNPSPSCEVVANDVKDVPGATLFGIVQDPQFKQNLQEALRFYQIDLPYQIEVEQQLSPVITSFPNVDTYQCGSHTSATIGDTSVNLSFPEKEAYFYEKLRMMLLASVLILLFISSLFIFANWRLWKQKRQAEINVDFFNNMAHEFRTPLTNISLASSRMAKKEMHLQDNRFLNIIKKESGKLMHQVERVLHLANLENGDYQLQKENLNLKNMIENVVTDLNMQLRDQEATVDFSKINTNLIVFADKLHLENVFKNLIDNSLKYRQGAPNISISTEVTNQGIFIKFSDNGIGISKANQAFVFDKFHRVGTGNQHNSKGFGLGLAYVKMILEKHCGHVNVVSEGNNGSRFELFLPKT
ncbi:MAG: two-component system phosphate regulon sensor histidine kinase PhoR [Paraglaciecola sp.]|jgi:two-component system phosphate regulon sensor histidine kinase PhoR